MYSSFTRVSQIKPPGQDTIEKGSKRMLFFRKGYMYSSLFKARFKGSATRFSTSGFFMNQFPPSPWVYQKGRFEFFRKFAEIFTAQGWPPVSLTPVAKENKLQSEIFLNNFVGTPLDSRVNIYKNFAFMFTLRQPDIVPIVCQRCRWHRRQIYHRCRWYRWCTLTCEYLCEKIWNGPNGILCGWGETDSWKKPEAKKSRETVPLKAFHPPPQSWMPVRVELNLAFVNKR
jgi:hypothetical protein